jgi:hypothetical protein
MLFLLPEGASTAITWQSPFCVKSQLKLCREASLGLYNNFPHNPTKLIALIADLLVLVIVM